MLEGKVHEARVAVLLCVVCIPPARPAVPGGCFLFWDEGGLRKDGAGLGAEEGEEKGPAR